MKPYYTALAIISLLTAFSQAAPPTITTITPRGVERGKPIEIVIAGANLPPDAVLWTGFDADIKRLPDPKPNPAQARFLLTASPKTPIGFFFVRVYGTDGVSAPALIAVDPFAGIPEKEDNNTREKAQLVPLPVVIDGQCAGGDVDHYRFEAKKGQRLVIETEAARLGAGLVPHLRLTDDKGRFLASDDSQRQRGDARLLFTAPADGFYFVELVDSRYRGAAPPQYRLKIGEYDAIDEVFPLGFHKETATPFLLRGGNLDKDLPWDVLMKDIPGTAHPQSRRLYSLKGWRDGMAWPEVLAGPQRHRAYAPPGLKRIEDDWQPPFTSFGRVDKPGEIHRFDLPVKEGQRLRFTVEAQSLGSFLDGQLRLTDEKGKLLIQADDIDVPAPAPGQPAYKSMDPVLEYVVPKGIAKIQVELRDALDRGGVNYGYLLTIEPSVPDFQLRLLASETNVPRDGFEAVPVRVARRGYDGPIQLECANPPPGWTFHGGYIPAKAVAGAILVQAPEATSALIPPLFLSIRGKALEGPPQQDIAEFRFLVSKEANPAISAAVFDKLAVGLEPASPLRIEGPTSVDLVHGLPKNLPIKISWAKDVKMPYPAVEINVVGLGDGGKPLSGGVTIKPASLAPGTFNGDLVLSAPTTMPDGRTHDFFLQAKAKVAGKDATIVGPAFRVTILRPFEIVVDEKHLLTPGQPYVLKGTLKRQPGFRDPVQLKLDALPPGVSAAPIKPIPGDQTTFQFELKVDAKSNPAVGTPTLTATATISGMAYTHSALKLSATIAKK